MCGIAGFIGQPPAQARLLSMLQTLEPRGYDSAGIKVAGQPVVKTVGSPSELAGLLPENSTSRVGIGHNRWATHGGATEVNAHPHAGPLDQLWLVHNGTLENFRDLRTQLSAKGHFLRSETDTEVFAHLIDHHYDGDLHTAVKMACVEVRGTYGIVVMHEEHPDQLVTACLGSPIVIGDGEDGRYIASDESALVQFTRRVVALRDGESAVVKENHFTIYNDDGNIVDRPVQIAEGDVVSIQKGGHDHFMRKEIEEGSEIIANTTRGRLLLDTGMTKLGGIERVADQLLSRTGLTIVGCGSAYYAGQVGAWMLREFAGIETHCELGSEFRHQRIFNPESRALIAVTQSGSTLDTRMSVQHAKDSGMLTLGIVNVVGSQIARETDAGIYNHAGPEIAVASTKAVLSQMTAFALLTVFLGRKNGNMSEEHGHEIVAALAALPGQLRKVLTDAEHIEQIAAKYGGYESMMFVGQGSHAPMAHEGALKLREVALKHTLGIAAGELKHGSIALLHERQPVVVLVPKGDDAIYDLVMTNIEQIKSRRAPVIAVATEGDDLIGQVADEVILVPQVHPMLQPVVSTPPLQLMSYRIGVNAGVDVDQPPNLAKCVTVA